MNRKIKWFLTLLTSGMLVALSITPFRMSHMISYINRYIQVGNTLMAYANLLFLQGILHILLAIIIPLIVWWKEE